MIERITPVSLQIWNALQIVNLHHCHYVLLSLVAPKGAGGYIYVYTYIYICSEREREREIAEIVCTEALFSRIQGPDR